MKKKILEILKHIKKLPEKESYKEFGKVFRYIQKIYVKFFIGVIIAGVGIVVVIFIYTFFLQDRLGTFIYIGDEKLVFPSTTEVELLLDSKIDKYLSATISFSDTQELYVISVNDLGITYDEQMTKQGLKDLKQKSVHQKTFSTYRLSPKFFIDENILYETLQNHITDLRQIPEKAMVLLDETNMFRVVPEQDGYEVDMEFVKREILKRSELLSRSPIHIDVKFVQPTIKESHAKEALEKANEFVKNILIFRSGSEEWKVPLNLNKQFVEFVYGNQSIDVEISSEELSDYFQENVLSTIEKSKKDIIIEYGINDTPNITNIGKNGYGFNIFAAVDLVNTQIKEGIFDIDLPIAVQTAKIIQSKNPLGIMEFIGEGESDFSNSPANRIHNIETALDRFQNIILAPKETFSFLDLLGPVNAKTGYKPELVIKKGGTELKKEYGGGICQVSSTLYRAILYTGLKIDTRRNHSIQVSHYTPIGLDATIYDPTQDFVFTNDTNHHILIQNEIDLESTTIYFRVWGTNDGRIVRLEGPIKYGYTSPGSPIYIDTSTLAPGRVVREKRASYGMQVDWHRYILFPDGEKEEKETFHSKYRAVPEIYHRGI